MSGLGGTIPYVNQKKILGKIEYLWNMKYIITEEQNNRIHILRRLQIFDKCMDEAIKDVNEEGVGNGHFKEYMSEVVWRTLEIYEGEHGEIEDKDLLEEYFKLIEKTFKNKIKKGYKEYLKTLR